MYKMNKLQHGHGKALCTGLVAPLGFVWKLLTHYFLPEVTYSM